MQINLTFSLFYPAWEIAGAAGYTEYFETAGINVCLRYSSSLDIKTVVSNVNIVLEKAFFVLYSLTTIV